MCVECWRISQDTIIQSILVAGLCAHIVILTVLISYSKTTFRKPFFTLCISLGFWEILFILKSLTEPIANAYMRENRDQIWFIRAHGFFGRIIWYCVMFHHLFIALERMTALVKPNVQKLIWSPKAIYAYWLIIALLTLSTNLCMVTDICAYSLYADGVTNFYNFSIPGAAMHNKVVDFGIQPAVILAIALIYFITGQKIIRLRRRMKTCLINKTSSSQNLSQCQSQSQLRKRRLEIALVLQGILISAPLALCAIFYHIIIYVPMPVMPHLAFKFAQNLCSKFAFTLSPFMYFFLNLDVRRKLCELILRKPLHQSESAGENTRRKGSGANMGRKSET